MVDKTPNPPSVPAAMSREEACRRLSANLKRLTPDANMMELSRRSGLCYRMLQYILKGEREPAARFVYSLAKSLNATVEDLFAPVAHSKKSRD